MGRGSIIKAVSTALAELGFLSMDYFPAEGYLLISGVGSLSSLRQNRVFYSR
ncbi:hypothetical protein EHW99_0785 [Erwinia amylovora]|nr:hypothetical protein EHX00_0785 [Erwinia amylovora]QJQ57190.1 hypothetical protein EHW99_0785 [Erwinia amylovora]QJQ60889.1 hypothetical protein EHW98_0785 [Erwinia amylovora]QJQ64691.1 hypothetical protein EHW96_0785 [Erwinia amylovora]QJQ68390.1 hypothetical protein EGZ89_0785 [Erwinia amylovora]